MGQVYDKTYFPQGYEEWINKTKLQSNQSSTSEKNKMSNEDYQEYVAKPDTRNFIEECAKHYAECECQIKNNMEAFIEIQQEASQKKKPADRIIYDILVGKIFSDFWLKLIDQPLETIDQYYADNVPKVEDTFYLIEKEHNLEEIYPAWLTIGGYKAYAS